MTLSKKKLTLSKKKLWTYGGALTAVVAVVVGVTILPSLFSSQGGVFSQGVDGECAPLVVLAFRGSGEANLSPGVTSNAGAPFTYDDGGLVTNGWEGETLEGLFAELSRTA